MDKPEKTGLLGRVSIRYTIYIYFTVSALAAILLIGISLYGRLSGQMTATIREENQAMLTQVNRSVDAYLQTIMKLSDSLCRLSPSTGILRFSMTTIKTVSATLPCFPGRGNF